MLIYPSLYELPLEICLSGDLSLAPRHGEELDAQDTKCLYEDTMHEDAIEFGDSFVRAPTQEESKIAQCFSAYNSYDVDEVTRVD